MELVKGWKDFLNKNVNIIINDPPSDIPKKKIGILKNISQTHLFLELENGKQEAILLTLIRRVELHEPTGWQ